MATTEEEEEEEAEEADTTLNAEEKEEGGRVVLAHMIGGVALGHVITPDHTLHHSEGSAMGGGLRGVASDSVPKFHPPSSPPPSQEHSSHPHKYLTPEVMREREGGGRPEYFFNS